MRRRRDFQSDDVEDFVTASERSRLKVDLEPSTWRRRHGFKEMPSRRDANPIRTLGDYSKPSYEGYMNTIELSEGNNVVPLRSDTIRLVQNECSFYELRPEDPNHHLKDFLKREDSFDLDVANRERMRLPLFQFSIRDQASNWLERLPAGSISTSNNIKESLFLKHGFDLRTYSKKYLIMASTFGSKSKSFMTMSIPPQDEPLTNRPVNDPEMFELLKELTASRTPKKEVDKTNKVDEKLAKSVRENVTKNEEEDPAGVHSFHAIWYYLKHRINEKLIERLVENHSFNDSMSATRVGKMKLKTYNLLPRGPGYDAILKKKITKKEDIGGNFEIPSADVLVDVAGYVYLIDFVILDIKEDENRPFILGTPFLTTAKAVIKFDKGTITLRFGKSRMSFRRIHESLCRKSHLLKDKQIPSVGVFDEVFSTWMAFGEDTRDLAHLEKKQTRPRLYTKWNECYDNEDELQSFRHKARQQDKVYEEREGSCWIMHLRTGIFYSKGHEGAMNEVPDDAVIFASSYWLRNSDTYRV
ncbi:MAK10-like protein [Tanacetum coccineum]